jgi:hypothetical protein
LNNTWRSAPRALSACSTRRPACVKLLSLLSGLLATCYFQGIGQAQQNLFNVPSSDITEKNKVFFQEQINLVSLRGTSHTTFTYGLGNNFEIGVNLFNAHFHPVGRNLENPSMLFNSQKGFNLGESHKISIGTQTGFTMPWYTPAVRAATFSYINSAIDLKKFGKYYIGGYYANEAYAGPGNSVGLMAGMEYELSRNKVHLIGDMLTGHNSISAAVLGAVLYLPGKWHISMGAQIPVPHNHHKNGYGIVFQLTHE